MFSTEIKILFWLVICLAVFIFYGIATDPSRKRSIKAARSDMAEKYADKLDRGANYD
jgi:hypothetical protein|nr:hypothetical protein [uncultured bacterium]AMP48346.1 hypothetical protein [uncultured bacterium]